MWRDRFPHFVSLMRSLDVVVATHNRAALVARMLESFTRLQQRPDVRFALIVVGNACTDDTAAVVRDFAARATFPVTWLEEPIAGKSYALNRGIAASAAEWLAFIDDDELIDAGWIDAFMAAQERLGFDFAAGVYIPDFEVPPPAWLPPRRSVAIIACHPSGLPEQPLTVDDGLMFGGNCVIRRAALDVVGPFSVEFSRQNALSALGCEDTDMQLRLLEHGFAGWFVPSMQILHLTPADRLTKTYFRTKSFWAGHNSRLFEVSRVPAGARVPGIERWRLRDAATAIVRMVYHGLAGRESERFDLELELRQSAGYVWAYLQQRKAAAG